MSHPFSTGSAAMLAAALLSAPAAAQQAQTTGTLSVTAEAQTPSLTNPGPADAREALNQIPGGVDLVPAEDFRDGRAATVKDMLDFTPGVFVQPRWAEESRLSIRGSGLSRNYHMRGVKLLQDGIPYNLADGSGDFQEIDPLTLRYVEVYKGANALQYGSTFLGGAINMISPTGHDASPAQGRVEIGSNGYRRLQASSGAAVGKWDYFLTPTQSLSDGYRDHSRQDSKRLNGNVGYRFSDSAETRLFLSVNDINQQVPSSRSLRQALDNPRAVDQTNITNDYARNVQSFRIADKTTLLLGDWMVDAGGYGFTKKLYHPIYQVIDQSSKDAGGFLRGSTETNLGGHKNRITLGANLGYGENDAKQFVNLGGRRGALRRDETQKATNFDLYGENQFFVVPSVALIAGGQLIYSSRETTDHFLSDGNDRGKRIYRDFAPKAGVLWQATPDVQAFANVSRSVEVPTFSELNPSVAPGLADLDPQRAITFEVGTRGKSKAVEWDLSLYRAMIRDELQIFSLGGGATQTLNAEHTIHQGIEVGLTLPVAESIATSSDRLTLREAYSFNDFRFDDDSRYGNNKLPGAPTHYSRTELRYQHPSGVYVAPNVEWVPQGYHIDNTNTVKTKPYKLYNVKAGYDAGDGLSLFVDGRNLADKSYIASAGVIAQPTATNQNVFFPGDGATVFAGVEYKW